ncbi:hypothetical protein Syun_028276 [Stephania yunnanensis]|uniref:Uncharacterized protein n=1 Tax=Stephania yunnanensis TaxID=152371 RepID=A0AAP0EJK7_9MAGN
MQGGTKRGDLLRTGPEMKKGTRERIQDLVYQEASKARTLLCCCEESEGMWYRKGETVRVGTRE